MRKIKSEITIGDCVVIIVLATFAAAFVYEVTLMMTVGFVS